MKMNEFYQHIFQKQREVQDMPSNSRIADWAKHVLHLLFPEKHAADFLTVDDVRKALKKRRKSFSLYCRKLKRVRIAITG